MKLNEYSVSELHINEMIEIKGGSWLSRRWDEVKALVNDIIHNVATDLGITIY